MAESMSNLEAVLRNKNGINIVLRKKLIAAYLGDNGLVEVPQLIKENERLISADLYPVLLRLAEDEDADI